MTKENIFTAPAEYYSRWRPSFSIRRGQCARRWTSSWTYEETTFSFCVDDQKCW